MSGSGVHIPSGRRYKRVKLSVPVMLVVSVDGERGLYKSQMLDVSERGAKLAANLDLAPGNTVEVMPAEGSGRTARSRVVRVRRGAPGQWNEIGLEFSDPVPLTMWISPKVA